MLIKPHFNSRLLLERLRPDITKLANVTVIDPRMRTWERFTAPDFIPSCFAIVTTPSSVVLDAAELGVPLSVAAYDLELPAFAGLPTLTQASHWLAFADRAAREPELYRPKLASFCEVTRLPGDAAGRISDLLIGEKPARLKATATG